MAIATCATRDFGHFRAFCTKMQVALATCSMSKTVQKAPGADGLRRLWTWAKQCKKHLEQMAYAACGHGQNSAKSTWSRRLTPPVAMGKTVQKAPGVDSKRRLWPCERSGGAKGFGPLQATCPAPLATRGGLEHVRHLGLMGGQVAPGGFGPSKPPACPPSPHLEGRSTCATWRKFEFGNGKSEPRKGWPAKREPPRSSPRCKLGLWGV